MLQSINLTSNEERIIRCIRIITISFKQELIFKCYLKQFVGIYIIINSVMAKKEQVVTRVSLYEDYRKKIVREFERSQKVTPPSVTKPKVIEKVVETPKITKAEALINEYEKSNKATAVEKKGPSLAIIILTIVIVAALITGVILLFERYYQ